MICIVVCGIVCLSLSMCNCDAFHNWYSLSQVHEARERDRQHDLEDLSGRSNVPEGPRADGQQVQPGRCRRRRRVRDSECDLARQHRSRGRRTQEAGLHEDLHLQGEIDFSCFVRH